jgi:PhnB protein
LRQLQKENNLNFSRKIYKSINNNYLTILNMTSKLNPYINFKNTAKGAMEFYQAALGGKLVMSTFKEAGAIKEGPEADNIMHAMLTADNGIIIMASDTPDHMEYKQGNNVSISLSGDNESELKGYWERLSEGGKVSQPLTKAPWGDQFGMFTDKFGIQWLINIAPEK